jgi:hypothetical protein
MKKYIYILIIINLFFITSCRDKRVPEPEKPSEEELITTVKLVLVDAMNASTVVETTWFENPFGEPGKNITIDTLRLEQNKEYLATVYLLDQSKNPVDTISYEVKEEADEHQLFYEFKNTQGENVNNLTIQYLPGDVDSHNVPLGLSPKFISTASIIGNLTVILKHQPDAKPTTGQGDINLGATDVEVIFPVKIQ